MTAKIIFALHALILSVVSVPEARGGIVRVWPAAVVVDSVVRIDDVCELRGFDRETAQTLSNWIVTEAPPAGGTHVIHMNMIRKALSAGGINMAVVTLRGAIRCEVTRPSDPTPQPKHLDTTRSALERRGRTASAHQTDGASGFSQRRDDFTLRRTIIDYFNNELRRYGGTANVLFDRASEQVLDLAGPEYTFAIRKRKGSPLGLTSVEVDVLSNNLVVKTVQMVVQVSMNRHIVTARRSINHGATIRAFDVGAVSTVVTRLDNAGMDSVAMAIGQRAKRFISIGTVLESSMLEKVPLVKRGEIVTVSSAVGGVQAVTTAKAAETGLLGDVIRIRALNNRKVEYDAAVVGPGRVEVPVGRFVVDIGQVALRVGS